MTVDYLLQRGNIKDVTTLIHKSKDIYSLQEEIRNLDSFKILKESDRQFLIKHMWKACVHRNLNDLNYCVHDNPQKAIHEIKGN